MNESKLANQMADDVRAQSDELVVDTRNEVRMLDDLELTMAGGGDLVSNWP